MRAHFPSRASWPCADLRVTCLSKTFLLPLLLPPHLRLNTLLLPLLLPPHLRTIRRGKLLAMSLVQLLPLPRHNQTQRH